MSLAKMIRDAFGKNLVSVGSLSDEDIVRQVYGMIRSCGYKYHPQSVTDDRTQTIAESLGVCIWESACSYRVGEGTKPLTWLLGNVRFYAANSWRTYAKQDGREMSDSLQGDRDGAGSDSARGRLFEDHGVGISTGPDTTIEDREILNRVMAGLTEQEQNIVRMKASGRTLQEIGAVLGVSHVTVWNRLKDISRKAMSLTNA